MPKKSVPIPEPGQKADGTVYRENQEKVQPKAGQTNQRGAAGDGLTHQQRAGGGDAQQRGHPPARKLPDRTKQQGGQSQREQRKQHQIGCEHRKAQRRGDQNRKAGVSGCWGAGEYAVTGQQLDLIGANAHPFKPLGAVGVQRNSPQADLNGFDAQRFHVIEIQPDGIQVKGVTGHIQLPGIRREHGVLAADVLLAQVAIQLIDLQCAFPGNRAEFQVQAEPGPDQKQQQKEQGQRQEEQGGTALLFETIKNRQKTQLLCSGIVQRFRHEQTKPSNRRIESNRGKFLYFEFAQYFTFYRKNAGNVKVSREM